MVSSDEIVHHLIRTDPEVKAAMLERLGDGILDEDGQIDRAKVGQVVFGDREALWPGSRVSSTRASRRST